jgi:nucleotide-binding universal stress UspA family protein
VAKITALIDASVYAASVCDHAAWAAERLAAPVEVLHMLGRRTAASPPVDYSGSLGADGRDALLEELVAFDREHAQLAQKRGRLILEQAKQRLTAAGVAEVTTRLRHGDLLEAVAEYEVGADLLVIGKRGEAADFASLHLGSNLERVVRSSTRPILVTSRAFQPIRKALIAFDDGASARKAVEAVAATPLLHGVEILVLRVGTPTPEITASVEAAARRLRDAGLAATASVQPGQADAVIAGVVEAQGIGLVVMGAYGHSRLRTLVIGSTTTEMIRSCKVPLLLFR